jgi:hypothetical protein
MVRPQPACQPADIFRVLHSVPMRFGTFFFGYFWFSHRTAAGEANA